MIHTVRVTHVLHWCNVRDTAAYVLRSVTFASCTHNVLSLLQHPHVPIHVQLLQMLGSDYMHTIAHNVDTQAHVYMYIVMCIR